MYTLRLEVALPGNPPQATLATVRIDHDRLAVRLTLPAPDSSFAVGTSVQLVAETNGPVARVEFVVDGQVIGSATQAATWSWLASGRGRHTIEVVAVDVTGQRTTSPPVSVLVQ